MLKKLFGKRAKRKAKLIDEKAIIPVGGHDLIIDEIPANTLKVLKRLDDAGFDAYVVGGGVRDLLLRQAPKDFDVATDARPPEVRKLFRNCRLIGRRFRLAHILFGREIVEVATFRASEKRHHKTNDKGMIVQDNTYGTLVEDAWRRDFTINALYFNYADHGIVDITGGMKDMDEKRIAIIGDPDVRYEADPVIMLRAIRFAAKLDFDIDEKTASRIVPNAHLLANVSNARQFGEVVKLFHSKVALKTYHALRDYGLFAQLFPQTSALYEHKHYPYIEKLVEITCENTDKRLRDNMPVTPAFLMAAFLWYPFNANLYRLQQKKKKLPLYKAMSLAMMEVIRAQHQVAIISKHHGKMMREIWFLQFRMPRRYGKKAYSILNHPRFRAAYDFLLIRAQAGEVEQSLADWWTHFQEADENKQTQMISDLPPKSKHE